MATFEDVIGYDHQKQELKTICDILKDTVKYKAVGVRPPHALMIYGAPGLGKTLMAKALIEESGRKCFCCKKSRSDEDFNQEIRDTFQRASAEAPSIVFLDDMDKFAEDNLRSDNNKEEFATIQSCMEDVRDIDVFVLATANDIENIPDSLMRPGRFGRKMFVGVPSDDDFLKISAHFLEKVKTAGSISPEFVTRLLAGRSPAVLEEAVNEAGISAGFRGDGIITKNDITEAILNVVYNMREQYYSEGSKTDPEQRRLVAYHEAGHAVVALEENRPISIISIIGSGDKGGVCMTPGSERYKLYKEDVESTVRILLGGRASVETLLGRKEQGVIADFDSAAELLRVCCEKAVMYGFGYGYDLGDWDRRGSAKRKDTVGDKIYFLMEEYYHSACRIVEKNKVLVKAIADELVAKSYLTFEDVDRIRTGLSTDIDKTA